MGYVYGSLAVVIGMSLPFLIFSKRVFSLNRRQLWWVFGAHIVRAILGSTCLALAWHFALPSVSIGVWAFLSAGAAAILAIARSCLTRTCFSPTLRSCSSGRRGALSNLIAFTAAAVLLVHIVLIVAFGLYRLATRRS